MDYAKLAADAGVPQYVRASTVGTDPAFIGGLARLVQNTLTAGRPIVSGKGGRICPARFGDCPLAAG